MLHKLLFPLPVEACQYQKSFLQIVGTGATGTAGVKPAFLLKALATTCHVGLMFYSICVVY